jgi:hypothetical protein
MVSDLFDVDFLALESYVHNNGFLLSKRNLFISYYISSFHY